MFFHLCREFRDLHNDDTNESVDCYQIDYCCEYSEDNELDEFTPCCPGCGAKNEQHVDKWTLWFSNWEEDVLYEGRYKISRSGGGWRNKIDLIKEIGYIGN
jgi:hypothetical protein